MAEIHYAGARLIGGTDLPAELLSIELVDPNPVSEIALTLPSGAVTRSNAVRGPDGLWHAPLDLDLAGIAPGPFEVRVAFAWKTKRYTAVSAIRVVKPRPGPASTGPTRLRTAAFAASDFDAYTGGWVKTPTVLEGYLFTEPLVIKAPTIIRESVLRTGSVAGGRMINLAAGGSLILEDSEVDGCGTAVLGLGYNDLTIRRSNIHSASDGVRVNSRVLVEDSWIHDLARSGSLHPDCIQTSGGMGVLIRHNVLDCTGVDDTGALDLGNAAVQLGAETNRVRDVTIEDNWLIGGNYTINVRSAVEGPLTITVNRFSALRRYGPLKCARPPAHALTLEGNVHDDGSSVTPSYW